MPTIARAALATALLFLVAACAANPPAGDATPPTPVGIDGDV